VIKIMVLYPYGDHAKIKFGRVKRTKYASTGLPTPRQPL
jgi:hypothetical protein